jgi:hypothetical protein
MTPKDLEPYLTAVAALFSVASFGYLLNLLKEVRETAKERTALMELRLDGAKEELARSEKYSAQEQGRLREELNHSQEQLNAALSKEGLGPQALALGRDLRDAAEEARKNVLSLVDEMQEKLRAYKDEKGQSMEGEEGWSLSLARGEMATGRLSNAAALFDDYTLHADATWDIHFARAVAHANAREGASSNLAALRAYNEALALAPDDLDVDLRSRLHGYRGAILKRMGRLAEAQSDLLLALKIAMSREERHDALYNIAGVYALLEDRGRMLESVAALHDDENYKGAIRAHLSDYFAAYQHDTELLALLN